MISEDRLRELRARIKKIDHTRILGVVKSSKDTAGLTLMGRVWKLLYYTGSGRSSSITLGEVTKDEAKWMRDQLYALARKAGAGFKNRKAIQAKQILDTPDCHDGIVFQVCFGGKIKRCYSLKEAILWRNEVCRQIIASNTAPAI